MTEQQQDLTSTCKHKWDGEPFKVYTGFYPTLLAVMRTCSKCGAEFDDIHNIVIIK